MKESIFQLTGQQLTNFRYSVNNAFNKQGESISLKIESNIDIKKDSNKNAATVSLRLQIFDFEMIKESPFAISIEYTGYFSWDKSFEKVDDMLKENAPAVLLGFIRPLIAQVTSLSGVPALVLPLINLTESNFGENS